MAKKFWSQEEIGRLSACETLAQALALFPYRSKHSVRGQAARCDLGLSRPRLRGRFTTPNDMIVAYTAGIVDGEGSIQLNPSKSGNGHHRYWAFMISIAMMAEPMLQSIRSEWGGIGSLNEYKTRGPYAGRRYSAWRIYSREAESFLRALLPHLRVKREHAEVALKFRRFVVSKRGELTDELSARRNQLGLRMAELNGRTAKRVAGPVGVVR